MNIAIVEENRLVRNKSTHEDLFLINVINKPNVGGIERLVTDFTEELTKNKISNDVYYLSKNKFNNLFFSKSLTRKLIIIIKSMQLYMRVLRISKSYKVVIIFHHAECHIVARLLVTILKRNTKIKLVIYLNQSPTIYPQKLIPNAIKTINSISATLCYSKTVAKMWMSLCDSKIYAIHSPVNIKRVTSKTYTNQKDKNRIYLLHLGRNVEWKSPEKSFQFAKELAFLGIPTTLTFVGIHKLDSADALENISNLEVRYLGLLKDSIPETTFADAMTNFPEFERTGEVIGIGALESLIIGNPVVVNSLKETGYADIYGIYEKDFFKNKVYSNYTNGEKIMNGLKISEREKKINEETLSVSSYTNNIINLINNI